LHYEGNLEKNSEQVSYVVDKKASREMSQPPVHHGHERGKTVEAQIFSQ